jgi:hypothetical protein
MLCLGSRVHHTHTHTHTHTLTHKQAHTYSQTYCLVDKMIVDSVIGNMDLNLSSTHQFAEIPDSLGLCGSEMRFHHIFTLFN